MAGLCAAGPLALGILNVLGAGTGMLINVVTVLMGVLGFVFAVFKALTEELRHGSSKARALFVGLAVIGSAILLVAGLATRTIAPLARLSGTADVAVVDLRSPTEDQQPEFDDLAAALSTRLRTTQGSEVRSYAGEVDAPIEELVRQAEPNGLRTWTRDFMGATDAELVIGGVAESRTGGQVLLRLFVYLPVNLVPEAEELTGWYPLGAFRSDRSISSSRSRQQLVDQVAAQFATLSAFLGGLDRWQAGYAEEAVADFAEVVDAEVVDRAERTGNLADLGRLFRGHAYESRASSLTGKARQRLLDRARRDYERIQRDTPMTARADVELGDERLSD